MAKTYWQEKWAWIGLFLITFVITGCGFHLRGHSPIPAQLKTLYIKTSDPYDPLTKRLQQTFTNSGITLVDKVNEAPVTLEILSATQQQQITSVGVSQQVTTYLLTYSVAYQLLDRNGNVILPKQSVSTSYNYSVGANQILGDSNVKTNLEGDMQRDVIYQILSRLNSPATQRALKQIS